MASSECAYERARLANIERNERMLRELNLGALKRDMRREERQRAERRRGAAQRREKKRKRKAAAQPQRRSRRARRLPPPKYTPDNAVEDAREEEQRREEEVANGWRDAETGLWRGERFGEVPGVPVGTVFGEGDYQRKGRFEMSRTGFFRPVVTPEWIDNNTKRFFLLLSITTMGFRTCQVWHH